MEELQPQELEELVQELERENGAEESLAPEVEALLQDLEPTRRYSLRRRAATQLGDVSRSSHQVVQALVTVAETDSATAVRAAAANSLRSPAHQAVLQRDPELGKRAQSAVQRVLAVAERDLQRRPRSGTSGEPTELEALLTGQSSFPIQCLKWSAIAGLVVGGAIGLWYAEAALSPGGSPACGAGFLVALIAGAVVGALVGGVVQGREDRITGMIIGAIAAGVAASLSWGAVVLVQFLEWLGA
jgi:hypothetical protein